MGNIVVGMEHVTIRQYRAEPRHPVHSITTVSEGVESWQEAGVDY